MTDKLPLMLRIATGERVGFVFSCAGFPGLVTGFIATRFGGEGPGTVASKSCAVTRW